MFFGVCQKKRNYLQMNLYFKSLMGYRLLPVLPMRHDFFSGFVFNNILGGAGRICLFMKVTKKKNEINFIQQHSW